MPAIGVFLRHCEEHRDEAIQPSGRGGLLDCFAALAMTVVERGITAMGGGNGGLAMAVRGLQVMRGSNEVVVKIAPGGVRRLDQGELRAARSGLDLLLACDGGGHLVVGLVPDEQLAAVAGGEARY